VHRCVAPAFLDLPTRAALLTLLLLACCRELWGIRWGDIIVSMDGEAITNERDLFACLDEHRPGQTVELGVQRGIGATAQKRTVRVTLADRRDTAGE
jgi:S1-C subfamily serine protease